MTSDCGPGLARRRRKVAIVGVGAGLLSALGLAFSGGDALPYDDEIRSQPSAMDIGALESLVDKFLAEDQTLEPLMGDIAVFEEDPEGLDQPDDTDGPHALMGKIDIRR